MPARKSKVRDDIVYDDEPRRRGVPDWDPDSYVDRDREMAKVDREIEKRRKKGESLRVEVPSQGRNLSNTFWGQAWNRNLMAYSDYESRMPRGRTYFRSGKVMNLEVQGGLITAVVAGTQIYDVKVKVSPLEEERWALLKQKCQGRIGSMVELLAGELSDDVMREVTSLEHGLFPAPGELKLICTCPDAAGLCKHLAATLYAVGSRFDSKPSLLFTLRCVDPQELFATNAVEAIGHLTASAEDDESRRKALEGVDLNALFDVDP
jgi:uncharacterized Zn finger protein